MPNRKKRRVAAIVCGGGPASGKNAVILAAVTYLVSNGWDVLGVVDGFSSLMNGKPKCIRLLPENLLGVAERGGCTIGTSRANPTNNPRVVVESLIELDVSLLITIRGDDTMKSAAAVAREGAGEIRVIHVPKTIDNDLPLPVGMPTFGYYSAVQEGSKFARVLMQDSATTGDRGFVLVPMGRNAGFLAMEIARAIDSLVLIPEEITEDKIAFPLVIDVLCGGILKHLAMCMQKGFAVHTRGSVLVVAEGVFPRIAQFEDLVRESFPRASSVIFDQHGHLRLSKVQSHLLLEWDINARLEELGVTAALKHLGRSFSVLPEKFGFGGRCIDPCGHDVRYCLELGSAAAHFGAQGMSEVVVVPSYTPGRSTPAIGDYELVTRPFADMLGPTGLTVVRGVDLNCRPFQSLLERRLLPEDLSGKTLTQMARLTNLAPAALATRFRAAAEFSERHRMQQTA